MYVCVRAGGGGRTLPVRHAVDEVVALERHAVREGTYDGKYRGTLLNKTGVSPKNTNNTRIVC